MNEDLFQMMELSQQGFCCSQTIVALGLKAQGKENPDLLRALSGLCGGMKTGSQVCGVLSGAVCLLSLYLGKGGPDETEHENAWDIVAAFVAWFETEYGKKYGGTGCLTILEGKPDNRTSRCAPMVQAGYQKARELLASVGIGMDGVRSGEE